MKFEILDLPFFEDARGTLVPLEIDEKLPFVPQRIYWVTAKNNQTRGEHAHILESEIFIAVSGCLTVLVNDGKEDFEIKLDKPNKALWVKPYCWHEFKNFSATAVMLCLSSTHYLPGTQNYITNKESFLKKVR